MLMESVVRWMISGEGVGGAYVPILEEPSWFRLQAGYLSDDRPPARYMKKYVLERDCLVVQAEGAIQRALERVNRPQIL